MPIPPPRTRVCLAVAALLCACAGCGTVWPDAPPQSTPPRVEAPAPRPAAVPPATAPGKHATRRDYYVLYHDFEIDRTDPLFAELDALPDQVFGELRLPPSTGVVQVFLFDTQERYERYMRAKYRNLPTRRAYFIAEPRAGGADELKIFTWMGDHLATDLRHELTHALLRGVLKEVPLWLDEGLAGYFELPPHHEGVNPLHLDTLRRAPFKPDLARLEKFTQVAQMEKPEYREAWAWVHLMLRSGPAAKKVLHQYLQALRTDSNPGPLLPRLAEAVPEPEQALVDHLGAVEVPRPRPRRAAAPK
ncbi:MAG: hypothetical protein FJ304_01435 [Planctomycetes bacterium]|nr:hypothetical protein [Planctomycetota bacterium]